MESLDSIRSRSPSQFCSCESAVRDEVFEFIQQWKDTGSEYKGKAIRARADKTPEQRKANSKIYKMAEHLKTAFIDRDVDADFKRSSVWLGEWEVVR